VPCDHWVEAWERAAIVAFARAHPRDGYRRLTFMMLDEDVVAVSPASVYRVLAPAGLLQPWNTTPSAKGTGFVQPLAPHEHWHGRLVLEHLRHVLLPVQRAGWL
jgi:hypothetical protein